MAEVPTDVLVGTSALSWIRFQRPLGRKGPGRFVRTRLLVGQGYHAVTFRVVPGRFTIPALVPRVNVWPPLRKFRLI